MGIEPRTSAYADVPSELEEAIVVSNLHFGLSRRKSLNFR